MNINSAVEKCFEYCLKEKDFNQKVTVFSQYTKSLPSDFVYQYPAHVIWKVTSACNLRCKHCFYYTKADFFDTQNDFSKEEALAFAQYLVEELNIMSVVLTGGEALLSSYLFDLIKYFKSKNVCVTLLTNGTLITEDIATKLVALLDKKYDNIQISFDGATAHTHDAIRGKGSFEKSLNALEQLSRKEFSPIIATTINSQNVKELDKFADLFEKYKIKELRFSKYKVFSKEQEYLSPNLDELFVSIAKLIDRKIPFSRKLFNAYDFLKYEVGKQLLDGLDKKIDVICNKLCHNHNKLFLSANGGIYLCTSSETAGLCLGNIREKSFDEIWNNRFEHPLFKERIDFVCAKCKYKYWCDSGCPVIAYQSNGDVCFATSECDYQYELE